MVLSKETRLVSGIILLTIPTIMYGGWCTAAGRCSVY